jgi:predicted amidohydrolase
MRCRYGVGVMRALLTALTSPKAEVATNLNSHVELLAAAARQGCDVVVFPEFSLTGGVDPIRFPERAIAKSDAAVTELVAATRRFGVAAVFGIGERDADELFITQLFASDGVLRGSHRKRHLGEDEEGYAVGHDTAVWSLAGTDFGIVVCAEAGVDFTWSAVAAAGASVVFFCAAPGLHGRRTDEASWRSGFDWWEECGLGDASRQAGRLGLWVAMATQAGSTEDEDFPGLAALVDPDGTVVSRLPDWKPGTLLVEIPIVTDPLARRASSHSP